MIFSTFYFLLSFFCFLFAYLSWRKPFWGLLLICASLPSYLIRFEVFGIPMTALEGMILLLSACWLIKKIKNQKSKIKITIKNLKLNNWSLLILLWLIIATISVFFSPNIKLALGHWKAYFLEPILFLIVFVDLVKNNPNQRIYPNTTKTTSLVLLALSFSALYLSIIAIYQKFAGLGYPSLEAWPDLKILRATSLFPHPNFLGLYLGPIVILAVGQLISSFRRISYKLLVISYWLLVIGLSLAAIIFARSEGAILGIFVGLIFYLFLILKKKQRIIFSILLLLVISCLLLVKGNYFYQKASFSDFSGQIRLKIWSETLEMFKDKPIFGAGLRGYQERIAPYHQEYFSQDLPLTLEIHPYPHNLFLAVWSELGLAGLIIFLLILVKFFKEGFKQKIFNFQFSIFNLAAMTSLLVHGSVDTPYFKNDLAILFWLIIGLAIINKNKI